MQALKDYSSVTTDGGSILPALLLIWEICDILYTTRQKRLCRLPALIAMDDGDTSNLALAAPALEELRTLFARAGLEEAHIAVLLKTVAAALVTKLCADLCQDGGSQALATTVEAAGAVAALVLAMPLLRAVAELLLGFFG